MMILGTGFTYDGSGHLGIKSEAGHVQMSCMHADVFSASLLSVMVWGCPLAIYVGKTEPQVLAPFGIKRGIWVLTPEWSLPMKELYDAR